MAIFMRERAFRGARAIFIHREICGLIYVALVVTKEVQVSLRHYPTTTTTEADDSQIDVMATRETRPSASRAPQDRSEPVGEHVEIYYPHASVGLFLWAFGALIVAAWAGFAPYVSPIFGFSGDGSGSWTWSDAHSFGALVPGALAFVSCLLILACARRPIGMQSAGTLMSSGALVFLCGAWLSVFPVAWAVMRAPYFQAASPTRTFEYWLCFASGPGVLLAAFGAMVMGRARIERVAHRIVNRFTVA